MHNDIILAAKYNMANFPYIRKVYIRKKDTLDDFFAKYAIALCRSMEYELFDKGLIPYQTSFVHYYNGTNQKENIRIGYDGEILVEFPEKMSVRKKLVILLVKEQEIRKRVLEIAKKVSKNRQAYERIFKEIVNELKWQKKILFPNSFVLTNRLAKPHKEGVLEYSASYMSVPIFKEQISLFEHVNNWSAIKYQYKRMILNATEKLDEKHLKRRGIQQKTTEEIVEESLVS